jgi:predicted aspartyl protease
MRNMRFSTIRSSVVTSIIVATLAITQPLAARPGAQHITALRMYGKWGVVEVKLGDNRRSYRFIVDTGAGSTVIDQALAHSFTVAASSGASNIQGASGSEDSFRSAKLRRLQVAGLSYLDLPVVLTDMRQFTGKSGQRYDGILGSDVLSRYSYVFDVPRRHLTLIEADRPDPRRWSKCIANPLMSRPNGANGFLAVPVSLHGGIRAVGIVDTGAAMTVLNWPAASATGLSKNGLGVSAAKGVVGFNPNASTASYRARINGATIASKSIPPFDARLSDLSVFESFGLKDTPGIIIGANIWRDTPFAATRGVKAFCGSIN